MQIGAFSLFAQTQKINIRPQKYARLQWENDVFQLRRGQLTDRYFTNGIRLDFLGNFWERIPTKILLMKFKGSTENLYGFSIGQNMYTPIDLTRSLPDSSDRPYAGWLYISHTLISNDAFQEQRLTTELDLGIIGARSFAQQTQTWVHKLPFIKSTIPQGWDNQIHNDLGINYLVRFEKRFIPQVHRRLDIIQSLEGNVGFVSNFVGIGTLIRVGWFNDYFQNASGLYDKNAVINTQRLREFYSRYDIPETKDSKINPSAYEYHQKKARLEGLRKGIMDSLSRQYVGRQTQANLDTLTDLLVEDMPEKEEQIKKIERYFQEIAQNMPANQNFKEQKSFKSERKKTLYDLENMLNRLISNKLDSLAQEPLNEVIKKTSNNRLQGYFFLNPVGRAVFDNSFLQGGIISSRKNKYVLTADQIERFYVNVEYGFAFSCGKFQLIYSQLFRTKEFKTAFNQQWAKISLTYGFN